MFEVKTRTVEVHGIVLPWVRYKRQWEIMSRWPGGGAKEVRDWADWPGERGEAWVTMSTLYALAEQGTWDSQFGSPFLLDFHEGLALEQAGLAAQETRGGYHRTDTLLDFLKEYETAQNPPQ